MLQYEFERVDCTGDFSFFEGGQLMTGDYQSLIRKRAADGWHFAGCVPAIQRRSGFIETMDLVFERETAEKEL